MYACVCCPSLPQTQCATPANGLLQITHRYTHLRTPLCVQSTHACMREVWAREPCPQPTDRHTFLPMPASTHIRVRTYLPTPPNNTTLLLHRAPQLIADPDPNPFIVHCMPQSHVQSSQPIHASQTGRNRAAEVIVVEFPDATARGASVVVVWCTAMIHACLECGGCWSPIVVAWDDRARTEPAWCDS